MNYEKACTMTTKDICTVLKNLWWCIEKGLLNRRDPYSNLYPDSNYLIEDWEQDLVSVLESRGVSLLTVGER